MAREGRRTVGAVVVVLGSAMAVVGVLGLLGVLDGADGSPPPAVPASAAADVSTPATTAPASPATTEAPAESPQRFVETFAAALQRGDTGFLLARLHPEVEARYGRQQCEAYLPRVAHDDLSLEVLDVGGPEPYVWTTDGQSTEINDVFTVTVSRRERGATTMQEMHLARTASELRWFTDCGEPR